STWRRSVNLDGFQGGREADHSEVAGAACDGLVLGKAEQGVERVDRDARDRPSPRWRHTLPASSQAIARADVDADGGAGTGCKRTGDRPLGSRCADQLEIPDGVGGQVDDPANEVAFR